MGKKTAHNPDQVSIRRFTLAIRKLPYDKPIVTPAKWYRTQKEHWLGWLSDYSGPGAYGRKGGSHQDARFAYNHIVEPKMLLWLIRAAKVKPALVRAAVGEASRRKSMIGQSAAVRRVAPWEMVESALWDT